MADAMMNRRGFFKLGGAVAAGLGSATILAGCGGGSGSGGGDTIKVGMVFSETGDMAQYGMSMRRGVELYVKKFNDDGGANGKKIDLQNQDDKGDATETVNAYNKLTEDGIVGVLGSVSSTATVALAQATAADNMPTVSPAATAADVVEKGKNTFRACFTDPEQGVVMADFAAEKGYKTIGTIFDSGGDYNKGVNEAFCEQAAKKGITISSQQGYSAGDVDFKGLLTTIIATNPDAIFCPNYFNDVGKIVTQGRELGFKGPFLGADGWDGIIGGDQEYASAEDLAGCFYDSSFTTSSEDQKVKDSVKAFGDANDGAKPDNFAALAYDAAAILLQAIKKVEEAGDKKAGSEDYKQAVIDAIAGNTVEGITGKISYAGTGDPKKSVLIIGIGNDGSVTVADTIEPSD